ncbi:MAG: hypothetical protein HeimC3_14170 [Candidatus Heimdallarchaeota archaeon LC_3]|nr:MAG: hypothetical protein HeimC3_14170 [Candidatus Heimdallarchaeota archaeon LC_3]
MDRNLEFQNLSNLNQCKFCIHAFFINIFTWKCRKFNNSINKNDIHPECFELDNRKDHIEYIKLMN